MKVKYSGKHTAISLTVNGVGIELTPNTEVEVTKAQADDIKKRSYFASLIKQGLIQFTDDKKAEVEDEEERAKAGAKTNTNNSRRRTAKSDSK